MLRRIFQKYKDIIVYLFFGVLTTAVNFAVYYPLYNWLGMSGTISNCIAWTVAVIAAYLTNKPFVFKSMDWSSKTVVPEFTKFVSCRLGSGLFETLCILVTVDVLGWNGNILKILVSIFVVIFNYFASKLFVFKNQ